MNFLIVSLSFLDIPAPVELQTALFIGAVLAAAVAGLFGILAMLGLVIWYLCTIDSDGVAYMAPFVDSERPALWRTLLRRPQPDNKFRPPEYGSENRRRQR